ncbi:MAG: hypothetical protein GX957_08485 [Clostridiaceae bacterium]|nr:hypothetical protein [Clostridiaceae bacterium]
MGSLLKVLSCILIITLIIIQILLVTPYRAILTNDELNGRLLNPYETLIYKGIIRLGGLGNYQPNSADVLINGIKHITVDTFPVSINVCDGDVVEVKLKRDCDPFYVYLVSTKGQVKTDLATSTVRVNPGINRIFKVLFAD